MKILEVTNYTLGGCGVGIRALKEAQLLSLRGHKVCIFSTNRIKGSNEICSLEERQGNVRIQRFSATKLGGESYMYWNFEKEALKLKPDVIIAHAYRHLHTTQALKIAKKLRCPIFLVTHAPFAREKSRTKFQSLATFFYDNLIGQKRIMEFTRIIAITKWELPYLRNLGVSDKKIVYIPNGIEKEFFKPLTKFKKTPLKNLIYIGRIAPIKQLETLIMAMKFLKGFNCKIIGPAESKYLEFLNNLIKKNKISNIRIINKSYIKKEQIIYLDNSDIFVLPSKSEGMPQTLIEAMARGKIVVASDNEASKEAINNGRNGFLFKNGNSKDLVKCINLITNIPYVKINSIKIRTRESAEKFKWDKIIDKIEEIILA